MALTLARPLAARNSFRAGNVNLFPWLVTAVVAFLVVVPIVMLLLGSFSAARLPTDFSLSKLTTGNYATVYTDPLTYKVMFNSVWYVAATLLLGLSMSTLFAWLVSRTNMPGKWLALAGIPLALIIPSLLESMVWVLLFSPRIGFVNQYLIDALHLPKAPFDVYSLLGMIALESLRTVPTGFLMLLPLFMRLDPSLEEAAMTAGAPIGAIARRVTLPLLIPGLLSVALYEGVTVLSSFEVPGIVGLPGHVYVFSTLVYTYTSAAASAGGSSFGNAASLSVLYLAINLGGLLIYGRVTHNASRYAMVSGRSYRPRTTNLGRWRYAAIGAVLVYLFITIVLPVLVLVWTSLTPRILQPRVKSLASVTGEPWQQMVGNADLMNAVVNTAITVAGAATLTVFASLTIGWIAGRTTFRARRLLDQLSFISHGMPGVILCLLLIWFWVRVDAIPIYGTLWIIILGLCTGFLAYGTRSIGAALLQVHKELEEAAYTSGAPPVLAIRRILTPLMLPALASLWLWAALQALRVVTLPLMLQTGEANTVLSVYLWREWEAGQINHVAAVGTALVAVMFVASLIIGRFGLLSRRSTLVH